MGYIFVIPIIVVIGYYLSLRVHPYAKCRLCNGNGRHFGTVYTYAHRRCRKCGGTGRKDRFGVRLINRGDGATQSGSLLRMIEDSGTKAAASLAGWIVGPKHADRCREWDAHLYGDPEGKRPTSSERLRRAAGFVRAAVLIRLRGVTDLAWWPVDALLASWRGSRLAMWLPVVIVLGLVLGHEGIYGLIGNAENLGLFAAGPGAIIKGLRKYRHIDTPKRPEMKTSSADGSEQ